MGGDTKPTQPPDIFDHVAPFPAERIRRRVHAEHDVMAIGRTDLDAVEAEDTGAIRGRIRHPRAIAVIREDDERKTGARRGSGNLLG